jgi:hypothetical protein
MRTIKTMRRAWGLCGVGLLACASLTGCQVSVGGQTLPSPYYIYDDVQYFPQGHEFILQNEADYISSQNAPPAPPGAEVGSRGGARGVQR